MMVVKIIKNIGRKILPKYLRSIYYSRLKSKSFNSDEKLLIEDLLEKRWSNEYKGAHDFRTNEIVRMIRKNDRLLDVGIGNCALLRKLKGINSLKDKLFGCDKYSPLIIGENRLMISGVPLCIMDIVTPCFKPGSFETIVLGEVIDYVDNTGKLITSVRDLLTEEGEVIISIPNKYSVFSFVRGFLDPLIRGYNPEGHKKRFSKYFIINILKENGFNILKVIEYGFIWPFLSSYRLIKIDIKIGSLPFFPMPHGFVIKAKLSK